MKHLTVYTDYTNGHLHFSTYSKTMTDEEYKEFMSLSDEEKKELIFETWDEEVDYEVNDRGSLSEIRVVEDQK